MKIQFSRHRHWLMLKWLWSMLRPILYRLQYRKKLWGNQNKVRQKKIFSPKSMTKLEDLTVHIIDKLWVVVNYELHLISNVFSKFRINEEKSTNVFYRLLRMADFANNKIELNHVKPEKTEGLCMLQTFVTSQWTTSFIRTLWRFVGQIVLYSCSNNIGGGGGGGGWRKKPVGKFCFYRT